MSVHIVGLGSNLGSRAAFLQSAIDLIGATAGLRVERVSPAYVNPPLGGLGGTFLNAAIRVEGEPTAPALLERLLGVERALGRVRHGHWAPRTVDLDLLWSSAPVHDPPRLEVPHPELTERAFALGPLLDVAPELEPTYGARLRRLGGRPHEAYGLDDPRLWDEDDRAAVRLARELGVTSGVRPPTSPPLDVRPIEVASATERGLIGRSRALVGSDWKVRRVALGPAGEAGRTMYVVGAPSSREQAE